MRISSRVRNDLRRLKSMADRMNCSGLERSRQITVEGETSHAGAVPVHIFNTPCRIGGKAICAVECGRD